MEEDDRLARAEKMLADFQEQAGRPFEHEARLKDLLTRQAALNAALDLDKGERQVAPPIGAVSVEGGDSGEDGGASPVRARDEKPEGWRRDRPAQRDRRDADEDDDVTVKQRPAPGPKF
jgi:hypothetical protein